MPLSTRTGACAGTSLAPPVAALAVDSSKPLMGTNPPPLPRSSTPRMPAQVDLLFNVRYGPPAVAPPAASRANKLQKVVLDYRPDAVDARDRSGSQSFTLDMPPGVRLVVDGGTCRLFSLPRPGR